MLEGKLVRLRAYRREDIEKALEYINDPEVKKYLVRGIPFPWQREDEEKWYQNLNPFSINSYSFAIEKLSSGEYIGGCGINKIDWKNSVAEVGIFLGRSRWNQGYGTDAMRILVGFIFDEMNINKIKLHTYSFNERAKRVYEKEGFKVEGILRQELFREGKYHDIIVMGLLRSEWRDFIEINP
ncbi:GNAT family protein [Thermotoga sp.]|uniref:GNAT family N-acetyltransferase n=1 Tax=Thermotoga sp. TaxID=28240 RepID=UPI0025E0F20C|nr:GNAT family protein [Thermotoga sp.]MCD6551827.1 GNAT family N-acetyltransferase [Thermotoga sp.]